ncbi:hypothetical protein [Hellea balneolensis]|uniref:hypothetical protein n=1 Tax=Hellea balneolensis TaxID=287478 RepID=UPI0004268C96|nr:hypothetical protein [Hellea balneolensis]
MTIRKVFATCFILSLTAACSNKDIQSAAKDNTPIEYASATIDLSTPQGTAYAMMIAMYRGDTDMVDRIFHEHGRLSRVKADGSVEPDGLERWRDWVGTLETGQAYEEIFGLRAEEYRKLATVWAPFVISFDGKIVGCGVNQLSMAKDNSGNWRIVSGMDTPAPRDSCDTFKTDYLAAQSESI